MINKITGELGSTFKTLYSYFSLQKGRNLVGTLRSNIVALKQMDRLGWKSPSSDQARS